jgi:hypothetical protein
VVYVGIYIITTVTVRDTSGAYGMIHDALSRTPNVVIASDAEICVSGAVLETSECVISLWCSHCPCFETVRRVRHVDLIVI